MTAFSPSPPPGGPAGEVGHTAREAHDEPDADTQDVGACDADVPDPDASQTQFLPAHSLPAHSLPAHSLQAHSLQAQLLDAEHFDPRCDDPPPPPAWVFEAARERDRALLRHAAEQPVDANTFTALAAADPAELDAEGLLDAIAATQRLLNYAQARQQCYLAAFARPGVATSLENLVDAALHPDGQRDQPFRPLADSIPADLPVDGAGEVDFTPLLADPAWRQALTAQAARDASAEVGCLLNLAPITARTRTEKALEMVDDLPDTLAAWQRGDLDRYRARIIADRTAILPTAQRRDVEQRVLPMAQERTGATLRRLTDRAVIATDPDAATERERSARQRRGVTLTTGEDGMATVDLLAPAPDAALVHGVLDSIATAVRVAGQADGRGASQLRADAMVDIFRSLNDTGHADLAPARPAPTAAADTEPTGTDRTHTALTHAAPRNAAPRDTSPADTEPTDAARTHTAPGGTARHTVALNVYLDAATLAGLDHEPGELVGYGAITADTARALAKSAHTVRAIVARPPGPDRTRNTVLDAGRCVYRPPAATAAYVTTRDVTCRFPGCRASAARCDMDHREPFERGGATSPHNLDLLCRAHHRLKTFGRWRAERSPDDSVVWTSPVGRRYASEPGHLSQDGPPPNALPPDPPPF